MRNTRLSTRSLSGQSEKAPLTLARWDVAVPPVDSVFVVCDVAPRLDIAVGVPAEKRQNKSKPSFLVCNRPSDSFGPYLFLLYGNGQLKVRF